LLQQNNHTQNMKTYRFIIDNIDLLDPRRKGYIQVLAESKPQVTFLTNYPNLPREYLWYPFPDEHQDVDVWEEYYRENLGMTVPQDVLDAVDDWNSGYSNFKRILFIDVFNIAAMKFGILPPDENGWSIVMMDRGAHHPYQRNCRYGRGFAWTYIKTTKLPTLDFLHARFNLDKKQSKQFQRNWNRVFNLGMTVG